MGQLALNHPPAEEASLWLFGRGQAVMAELADLLSREGYQVTQVKAPTPVASGPPPDLLLANLEPPGTQETAALREFLRRNPIPVICLVPIKSTALIRMALELHAADVLCKPVRPDELISRVAALLSVIREKLPNGTPIIERRAHERRSRLLMTPQQQRAPQKSPPSPIRIDDRAKIVYVNGQPVRLSPKEYQLIYLLSSEPGRVISPREIAAHLWPTRRRPSGFEVQQYIHFVRRKLEADPGNPRLIVTVKGFGYKLVSPDGETLGANECA